MMQVVKLNSNRTIPKTFASMNVQATTAPANPNQRFSGRNHTRPALVKTGSWTSTDWILIAVLIVAMFVLEAREA